MSLQMPNDEAESVLLAIGRALRLVAFTILVLLGIGALVVVPARADDGGAVKGTPVNGPESLTRCPALLDGGAALCFAFPAEAKAARLALKVAPTAAKWRQAAEDAAAAVLRAQEAQRRAEGLADLRTREARDLAAAAEAQKARAEKLDAALNRSWIWSIVKYILPSAALGGVIGYVVGRKL